MKRRRFIRNSAITAVGLGLSSPLFDAMAFGSTRPSAATGPERVVVMLNLFGGNDGLNTVVPLDQYALYAAHRPRLAIPRERLLALPDAPDYALNPALGALASLYGQGRVAVIAGVGAPRDSRGLFDHAASQEVFQTAQVSASAPTVPTGWLGRWLDVVNEGIISPGIDFGGGRLAVSGSAREALTISSIEEFRIQPSFDTDARLAAYQRIMGFTHEESAVGERNRQVRVQALEQSAIVRERTAGYQPGAEYPSPDENYLARSLMQCAQLITADLGVRALSVGYDGFDTHAGQDGGAGDGALGYHDYLLATVSDSVAAFYADLAAHGAAERVAVVIVSEFGRRPQENNDRGTDHGLGSVALVVGGAVRGGFYGEYPSLAEDRLVLDGNVDVTTDFRAVYATVLEGFLGTEAEPVLGGQFPTLSFF